MLKRRNFSFFLLLLFFTGLLNAVENKFEGKKIIVYPPVLHNFDTEHFWLADYVQGELTTDFQEYSDLSVINRMNLEAVMSEQSLAEVSNYALKEDFLASMEYASLVYADLLVTVEITYTGNFYAIRCGVTDVLKATAVSGVACSFTGINESELSDGTAIHKTSYELLSKMNINQKKLLGLSEKCNPISNENTSNKNTPKKNTPKEYSSNYNLAKGINSQNKGNIVEAMMYLTRSKQNSLTMQESDARLNAINNTISGRNIKDTISKEILLRKEWIKIWSDFRNYQNDSRLQIYYSTELIKVSKLDYEHKTATVQLPVVIKENAECQKIYFDLLRAYNKIPKNGDWGLNTSYETKTIYNIYISLKNEKGDILGKKKMVLMNRQFMSEVELKYDYAAQYWIDFPSVITMDLSEGFIVDIETDCKGAVIMELPGYRI